MPRERFDPGMSGTGSSAGDDGPDAGDRATRVVVTYDESALDERLRAWVSRELGRETYRRYLARAHETAAEGDEWTEFVSRGCGSPVDVTLRVARVEGGSRLDPETTVEISPR